MQDAAVPLAEIEEQARGDSLRRPNFDDASRATQAQERLDEQVPEEVHGPSALPSEVYHPSPQRQQGMPLLALRAGKQLFRAFLNRVQRPEPAQVNPAVGDDRGGGEVVRQLVNR